MKKGNGGVMKDGNRRVKCPNGCGHECKAKRLEAVHLPVCPKRGGN